MELLGFLKILEGHEALDSKFAYIVSYSCVYIYIHVFLHTFLRFFNEDSSATLGSAVHVAGSFCKVLRS